MATWNKCLEMAEQMQQQAKCSKMKWKQNWVTGNIAVIMEDPSLDW